MAEELQVEMQTTVCQAPEETLQAMAKDFELDISEQRKSTIVCMIFNHIDKELMDKNEEQRMLFSTEFRSRYFKSTEPKEKDVSESVPPVKQNAGQSQSTLQGMLESTSVFRRQFKIVGQIGQPNEKDKLSFTSLTRQIDTEVKQGYTEQEIVDGVIRAINGGMVLRSYVETYKDLSLERLRKILRNHYDVKSATELYQSLASICQGSKETPQEFLMRALDLRQKILFSSTQDESEDTLVYENDHIQKLFLRAVETGLQDENVRVRVRGYLRNPTISDEELILQVNNAVSTENERVRKLRNQNRPKPAQVSQVAEKAESQDKILKTLEALKVEVAQVKSQLKDINQETEQARLPNSPAPVDTRNQRRNMPPKCLQCQTSGNDKCSHCFICGSDNHFAIGCRQNRGKNALNYRRLPLRGQK
ncbi:Hypothetical predicted protein [Paramuricea clavata]|uniref:Uncharacterized protein n=1 Tax=Paramuricea clavata TaxID=317549 RepID=A0A6S7GUY1_PARCT|nr:Hypothetical predicted protein [Paramuricea clavata]